MTATQESGGHNQKPRRPFAVTLLAGVVLCLTAINAIRFGAALAQWPVLAEFASPAYAVYIAATGLVWALIGGATLIALWRGFKRARWGSLVVTLAYLGYYWLDRLLIQKMPAQNTLYVLAVQGILLVFCALTVVGAKGYFSETVSLNIKRRA